ncbi:MAG: 6,7-dimethyl-8-ribityllumazine synthase [Myxococcota bacterium]|nr:6,7-dimethyl-8-ribityllumazine synthase [Myxococcota bacterium]MDW8363557.1 6,7-dimethyl-8-ribityllumazine synthase [Myxococcales bacterium]
MTDPGETNGGKRAPADEVPYRVGPWECVGVVAARWNAEVVDGLVDGAVRTFAQAGFAPVRRLELRADATGWRWTQGVGGPELTPKSHDEHEALWRSTHVVLVHVPGAWEIPLAVDWLFAKEPRVLGIVAIGVVVRGRTAHFDEVLRNASEGCARVQRRSRLPVAHAILGVDDLEQARERSGPGPGNRGREAALAALHMMALRKFFGIQRR